MLISIKSVLYSPIIESKSYSSSTSKAGLLPKREGVATQRQPKTIYTRPGKEGRSSLPEHK